jgi:hypothetical protein
MPEFVRVWGNNGIREVPVIQGVQEIIGGMAVTGSSGPQVIVASTIPFLIMPGDGSANGCQFTGTGGAFTLTAAIIANIGASLAGCYAYFSANFGGSSLPAGWYWTEFSSDTAGIVYANTYTSGKVSRPVTKTPITPNLSGWVTGTTSEVTGPTGFILPGGALGKNGFLSVYVKLCGSIVGSRNYRARIVGTQFFLGGTASSPMCELLGITSCIDSHTEKVSGKSGGGAITGIGVATTTYSTAQYVSVNTSIDTDIAISLQGSVNTSAPILLGCLLTSTYGE